MLNDEVQATKYVLQKLDKPRKTLDEQGLLFNDFLSLFLKSILKKVLAGIADAVSDFRRKPEQSSSHMAKSDDHEEHEQMLKQKSLCLKLSEYQREQLFQLLEAHGDHATGGGRSKQQQSQSGPK